MSKEPVNNKIKKELDGMKLQAALGKAEAADFIEERKEEFGKFIEHTKDRIENSVSAEDNLEHIHQKLDNLKLQLALGRMEAEDVYDEQKKKIEKAIDATRDELQEIDTALEGTLKNTRTAFEHNAGAFTARLQLFARHWKDEKNEPQSTQEHINEVLRSLSNGIEKEDLNGHPIRVRETWTTLKTKVRKIVEGK